MRHAPLVAALVVVAAAWGLDGRSAGAATVLPEDERVASVERAGGDPPRQPSGRVCPDPQAAVSEERLFGNLEALTAIRPFAGWRNSASRGEAEAFEYLASRLERLQRLHEWGLELERRAFHTYSSTEFRDTRVHLIVDGVESEVPAFGLSGHRDWLRRALLVDSDGQVNDSGSDPVVVSGPPVLVRSLADVAALPTRSLVVLDFAFVDRSIVGYDVAWQRAQAILDRDPLGIVCVTSFSNVNGSSHGTFAGDVPAWMSSDGPLPPILNLRIEDAAGAGIGQWSDFQLVDEVRMTWDMDVHSPGDSQYLAARIPGQDSSRAVILGAHVDSPNSFGGVDDGSGVVSILQVAEALDSSCDPPAVDVYLVFYGSHERGVYGSSVFVAEHQELLDRTLAVLQVDCLSVPLDGIEMFLNLETWPFGRFGDARLLWPDYLSQLAADRGIYANPLGYYGLVSDNSNYTAWDVPNANLIFMNPYDPTEVHYAGHMHDPYDTAELARSQASTVVDMATLALAAALDTGRDNPLLRVTPAPVARAVVVASHTECPHMTPTHLVDFGMALAWHGLDLDLVPYGQPVASGDLADAALVVVLPVHDYPSVDGDVDLYDEAFTETELDALEAYAGSGGLLVVTNSAHRLKYSNYVYEANEDSLDMNALAGRFGVEFMDDEIDTTTLQVTGSHPLVSGLTWLAGAPFNGVAFAHDQGQVLAQAGVAPAVVLVPTTAGEVLVLADLGLLGNDFDQPENLGLWENLADYALSR